MDSKEYFTHSIIKRNVCEALAHRSVLFLAKSPLARIVYSVRARVRVFVFIPNEYERFLLLERQLPCHNIFSIVDDCRHSDIPCYYDVASVSIHVSIGLQTNSFNSTGSKNVSTNSVPIA